MWLTHSGIQSCKFYLEVQWSAIWFLLRIHCHMPLINRYCVQATCYSRATHMLCSFSFLCADGWMDTHKCIEKLRQSEILRKLRVSIHLYSVTASCACYCVFILGSRPIGSVRLWLNIIKLSSLSAYRPPRLCCIIRGTVCGGFLLEARGYAFQF